MTMAAHSPAADSLAGLLACRALAEAPARLACFDRESALLAGAAPPPPAASTNAPMAPAPPRAAAVHEEVSPPSPPLLSPTEQFGLPNAAIAHTEGAAGARAPELKALHARVSNLKVLSAGIVEFTLDNGQVWEQTNATGDLLVKSGDKITIAKGWFNSYSLQVPSGRECTVKRVR